MKKKQAVDLEQEYTPNAATEARRRERACLARWETDAMAREVERRRLAAEEAQRTAEPIADRDQLAAHVAKLAAVLGLRRKKG